MLKLVLFEHWSHSFQEREKASRGNLDEEGELLYSK